MNKCAPAVGSSPFLKEIIGNYPSNKRVRAFPGRLTSRTGCAASTKNRNPWVLLTWTPAAPPIPEINNVSNSEVRLRGQPVQGLVRIPNDMISTNGSGDIAGPLV